MGVPAHTRGCTQEGVAWTHAGKRRMQPTLNENGGRPPPAVYLPDLPPLFAVNEEGNGVRERQQGGAGRRLSCSRAGSPAQEFVPVDGYEVREEVRRHAVGEDQADLALHPAKRHFEKPGKVLRSGDEPERQDEKTPTEITPRPALPPRGADGALAHQLTSFQSFFVAVEADPGTEDDGAHEVDVAHELNGRRHAGHNASVQIEGQRDGLHGDHHL